MFDLANPQYLYLLLIIPLVFILYWMSRRIRTRNLIRFGKVKTISHLMPDVSKYIHGIKIVLQLIIIASIVVMLCRPRNGEKDEIATLTGIEVYFALDVSNSMLASASDDPLGISRLEKSKMILEKLIEKLDNNRIGLIVFAGDAYLQLPLTTDFVSAKQYIDIVSPEMVSTQGTAIAEAIGMAMNTYTSKDDINKALILITDSEDHLGDAIQMAQYAADKNIQVDVIGLGTKKGAPIPTNKNKTEFLTYDGINVNTALNEQLGYDIAKAGKGIYVNGISDNVVSDICKQLETLSNTETKTIKYKATAELFPLFAWIALILLVVDVLILNKKIEWLKRFNFFSK